MPDPAQTAPAAPPAWSAAHYTLFEAERTRPARDLLAAIRSAAPQTITDLGCGPGNATEILAQRFPRATLTGIDMSPDMLAAARRRLPEIRFLQTDIATWQPEGPQDLVFANAALHWLPDHPTLLPRLMKTLSPAGTIAIQMPDNLAEPTHRLIQEIAKNPRWSSKLANAAATRTDLLPPGTYYTLLRPHAQTIEIWRTTYYLPLADTEAIVNLYASTGLRPYLNPLTDQERLDFKAAYQAGLATHYGRQTPILLPTPRLFLLATTA